MTEHRSAPPRAAGEITVNGQSHACGGPLPLRRLLEQLGVTGPHVAVEVNLRLVPRQEHERCVIQPGDQLEVVTLTGGG